MLDEHHREYLAGAAINVDLAEEHGVESTPDGIVFPYRNPGGRVVEVFRPDDPGDGAKYVSPKGQAPGLNVIVSSVAELPDTGNTPDPGNSPLLLVEGTKQALAVASWVRPSCAVAGMSGCWGFRHRPEGPDGPSVVIPDLDIVEGRDVIVAFDADYHTNDDVRAAGEHLAQACLERGATSVRRLEHEGQGTEGLDDILARLPETLRTLTLAGWIEDAVELVPGEELGYVDIIKLLSEDEPEDPWLFGDVLVRGFGHVIYAPRANQKSLFTLWMLVDIIRSRDDVHVLYLDYEMGRFNLRRRLSSMGFTPDSPETQKIHARLHYWPFPDIPALDTNEGGIELTKRIEKLVTPDQDLVVVVDTTIRAVEGEENASNTVGNFTRYTAKRINAVSERNGGNITWIRVDHAGKDVKKGQRGSSAKGDDVGMIWRISMQDDGITLENEKDREGFLHNDRVRFNRLRDPLRFVRIEQGTPAEVEKIINALDADHAPLGLGRDRVKREFGITGRSDHISTALRLRRERAKALGEEE